MSLLAQLTVIIAMSPDQRQCKSLLSSAWHPSVVLPLLAVSLMIVSSAWLSDDAYITFRTIDNFVHGYGPRFNVVERVQAYTHPLWMLILSGVYFFTREIFLSALAVSILFSLGALIILIDQGLLRRARLAVVLICCAMSQAFVDYSTSGLENPLSYFLVGLFFAEYMGERRERLFRLWLIAALIAVNRIDLLVIIGPALAVALPWRSRSIFQSAKQSVLGFSPLLCWLIFSFFYYGSLSPNTALAKLNTGIQYRHLVVSGWTYLRDSAVFDPLTTGFIVLTLVMLAFSRAAFGKHSARPFAFGVILYAVYVLAVGGDFMLGRFFSVPFYICTLCYVTAPELGARRSAVQLLSPILLLISCLFVGGGGSVFRPMPDVEQEVPIVGTTGRAEDERGYYYRWTGLANNIAGRNSFSEMGNVQVGLDLKAKRQTFSVVGAIGVIGYYAGPDVYLLDVHALSDPFLARLPVQSGYRYVIGHYYRPLPPGYSASLVNNTNVLEDPGLRSYYDVIKSVTRDPVFDLARLQHTFALNLGRYQYMLQSVAQPATRTLSDLAVRIPAGSAWDAPGAHPMTYRGLLIVLPEYSRSKSLEVSLKNNAGYTFLFLDGSRELARFYTESKAIIPQDKLAEWQFDVPLDAVDEGYNRILILPPLPLNVPFQFSVGHLVLH